MNLWVTFKNPIMISKLRSCSPAWSAPTKGSQNSWAKLTAPLRGRSHCPSLHWCTSPPCSPCSPLAKFLALQHRAIWLIMPVNSYSLFCCALFLLLFFFFFPFLQVQSTHSAFKCQNHCKGSSKSAWPDTSSSQLWFGQLAPKAPQQPKKLM